MRACVRAFLAQRVNIPLFLSSVRVCIVHGVCKAFVKCLYSVYNVCIVCVMCARVCVCRVRATLPKTSDRVELGATGSEHHLRIAVENAAGSRKQFSKGLRRQNHLFKKACHS